jgi:hypothetical protein
MCKNTKKCLVKSFLKTTNFVFFAWDKKIVWFTRNDFLSTYNVQMYTSTFLFAIF